MRWTLVIKQHTPPGLNTLLGRHWAESHRLKLDWFYLLYAAAQGQRIPKPNGKRVVTIIRYYAGKELDYDNYVGGCKQTIVDRLKPSKITPMGRNYSGLGLILDDDSANAEVIYRQKRVRHREEVRTEIHIEEAGHAHRPGTIDL